MNQICLTLRHCTKVCKSIGSHRQLKGKKCCCQRTLFVNKSYRGYYTHRIIYNAKKFRNRFMFGTISLAIGIVEPTEKQKIAFIRKLKTTYAKCLVDPENKIADDFEKCKACKDHFKSYIKPMREDIDQGCHLRDDVVTYIANYCGIDELIAIEFLLSIGREDDFIGEICKWMGPCTLSDKTKAYPTEKQKNEFMNKFKETARFEACIDCKRQFAKRLESSAPKPFIINNNVKKETKKFANVEDDWLWGKENKKEYIERVCGIMGVCED